MYLLDLPQAEGKYLIRWKQFLLNICLVKLREQNRFFELLHLEMPFILHVMYRIPNGGMTYYRRHLFIKLQLCCTAASSTFYCLGQVFNSLQRDSNLTSSFILLSNITAAQKTILQCYIPEWKTALHRIKHLLCTWLFFCRASTWENKSSHWIKQRNWTSTSCIYRVLTYIIPPTCPTLL